MGKLLAVLLLRGVVRVKVQNEIRYDQEITCSAIAVGANSMQSSKKRPFRQINYLHPSRSGLKHPKS